MRKKSTKIISSILMLIFLFGGKTYASELSETQKGVIVIKHDNIEWKKQKFLCDKIADLENESYVMKEGYTNSKQDINCIHTAEQLKVFTESLNQRETKSTITAYPDQKGEVRFESLDEGVYFIRTKEGTMIPVLVSLPFWDEKRQEMQSEAIVVPKYIKVQSQERKDIARTGDYEKGLIKAFLLLMISSFAIIWVGMRSKILRKY